MSPSRSTRAAATAAFLVGSLPGAVAVTAPAWAAPPPVHRLAIPTGTAPGATGLPTRPAAPRVGPLPDRVRREAASLEVLTERLVEARDLLRQRTEAAAVARERWAAASALYRGRRDGGARSSHVLLRTALGTDEARQLAAAARAVGVSGDAYARAFRAAAETEAVVRRLGAEHARRTAALTALRARHRAELEAARARTDRYDAALSRQYLGGERLAAGDEAPGAVRYALAQVGRPYVWGAEGPGAFDCSGLVQAAYAAAGVALPRTARPQYLATVPVPVSALAPGDLLFFGPDRTRWSSIHHVGIYLGRGLMVHAPTTGDVVRVAPIWWAEFFGATRVTGTPPGGGADLADPADGADRADPAGGRYTVPVTRRGSLPAARPVRAPSRPVPAPAPAASPPPRRTPAVPPRPAPAAGSPPPAGPACPPSRPRPVAVTVGPVRVTVDVLGTSRRPTVHLGQGAERRGEPDQSLGDLGPAACEPGRQLPGRDVPAGGVVHFGQFTGAGGRVGVPRAHAAEAQPHGEVVEPGGQAG
ncbi:MAG TPA: C40 family peptidase [Mycobacteriales bacterium]|nr:C40 family peptidase [Mycobacteriales bacterium]